MINIQKQRIKKEVSCAGCKRKGIGEQVLYYENNVLVDVVLELPINWKYEPFANNGEAPFCTACLKQLKWLSDGEYS